MDGAEGWSVGEEGVILHTIDAGKTWERQPTATRATLEAVVFTSPYEGWVVGHDDRLPEDASGVVLFSKDGGISWKRILAGEVPALFSVQFAGNRGWLLGKANYRFPGGMLETKDGGLTWKPGPSGNVKGFVTAAQNGLQKGLFVGGPLGVIGHCSDQDFVVQTVDPNSRRTIRAILAGNPSGGKQDPNAVSSKNGGGSAIAVGEQGLALRQTEKGWESITGIFSNEAAVQVDFLAGHSRGKSVWLVGRPGSFVAKSEDGGKNWQKVSTHQNAPLRGLFFVNEKQGYAVGDRGTILGTMDGGQTWKALRSGGTRAGVLVVGPTRQHLNRAMIAQVGWVDGVHAEGWVASQSLPGESEFQAGNDAFAHLRNVGATGFSAGLSWSGHQNEPGYSQRDWSKDIEERLGGEAVEKLTRSLVLALRASRPESVIVELAGTDPRHHGLSVLLQEALGKAIIQANDPARYPEQISEFKLAPWKVSEVLNMTGSVGPVRVDLMEIRSRLGESLRDFTVGIFPSEAGRLARGGELWLKQDGSFSSETPKSGLVGRGAWNAITDPVKLRMIARPLEWEKELDPNQLRAIRRKNQVMQMMGASEYSLLEPDKLGSNLEGLLKGVEEDASARVHLALARVAKDKGNWNLARELYTRFLDRFPAHPGVIEAATWVIVHNSSGEARRRHELRQVFREGVLQFETTSGGKSEGEGGLASLSGPRVQPRTGMGGDPRLAVARAIYETPAANTFVMPIPKTPQTLEKITTQTSFVDNVMEAKKWYQDSVDAGGKMTAFGSMVFENPRIRFAWLSASRKLGEHKLTQEYCEALSKDLVGPVDADTNAWRRAGAMELWLSSRKGNSPMPSWACRKVEGKPWLDGNLDEPFWTQIPAQHPMKAKGKPAGGVISKEVAWQRRFEEPVALFAHDDHFLYMGIRVKSSAPETEISADNKEVALSYRGHDSDLSQKEHLAVVIDIDRDYSSTYRFRVDPRGWIDDSCWEDPSWDPRWFVASRRSGDWWEVELAIPLSLISSERISHGKAWALGISHHTGKKAGGLGNTFKNDLSWSGSGRSVPLVPSPLDFGILMFQSPNMPEKPTKPNEPKSSAPDKR